MFFLLFFKFSSCYLSNLSVVSLKSINSPLFRTASPLFIIHSSRMSQTIPLQLHFSNFMIIKSLSTLISSSNFYGQQISLSNSHFKQFLQRPFYLAQYDSVYDGKNPEFQEQYKTLKDANADFTKFAPARAPPSEFLKVINCDFADMYHEFPSSSAIYTCGGVFYISFNEKDIENNPNLKYFQVTMDTVTFTRCRIKNLGGAVFVSNAGEVQFNACHFEDCTVTSDTKEYDVYGNAIAILNVPKVTLTSCSFNEELNCTQFNNSYSSFTVFFDNVPTLHIANSFFKTSHDDPADLGKRPAKGDNDELIESDHQNAQIGIDSSQPIQLLIYYCCFIGDLPPITYLSESIGDGPILMDNYYEKINEIYHKTTSEITDSKTLDQCHIRLSKTFSSSEEFSSSEGFSESSDFSLSESFSQSYDFTPTLSYSTHYFTWSSEFSLSSYFSPSSVFSPTDPLVDDYHEPKTKKLSTGAIIGIVIAILALILIIVLILYCFVNIKKKAFIPPNEDPMNIDGLDVPLD